MGLQAVGASRATRIPPQARTFPFLLVSFVIPNQLVDNLVHQATDLLGRSVQEFPGERAKGAGITPRAASLA